MTDTEAGGLPAPPPRPVMGRSGATASGGASGAATAGGSGPAPRAGLRLAGLLAVLAFLGWRSPWMLVVILAILLMVFLHELGHYITAKKAGMKVTEFFIGFGPRLWSVHKGETEYGLKLLPLGAYVKIIGMHNLDEVPAEDEGRTYRQKSFGRRLSVAVAGSTMHFLLALTLIFVALVAVGQPGGTFNPDARADEWVVGSVVDGSGAADAGIREGDRILSVAGRRVSEFSKLRSVVLARKDQTVPIVIERNGDERTVDATLRAFVDDGQRGCCLGVGAVTPVKRLDPLTGLARTPREFGQVTVLSTGALGKFFTPSGISSYVKQVTNAGDTKTSDADRTGASTPAPSNSTVSRNGGSADGENRLLSIVGLVRIGEKTGQVDAGTLIGLFALINIFIGVFNLVPLLPFDGGHVAIAVYEKVQERRLHRTRYFTDVTKLLPLTYAVVMVLGMIFVSSLYLDILNPIEVK